MNQILPGQFKLESITSSKWHEPNFETFGTIAFERDLMRRMISFGVPTFSPLGEFLGWNEKVSSPTLNVSIWFSFVPEAYRDDVKHGTHEVGKEFLLKKITQNTRDHFVEAMRYWIGRNMEPK